jgi:signal transduction histidine kinase
MDIGWFLDPVSASSSVIRGLFTGQIRESTHDLVRSQLSHDTATYARIASSILDDWARGRRREEDAAELETFCEQVEDALLRHARLAARRFATLRFLWLAVITIRRARRALRTTDVVTLDRVERVRTLLERVWVSARRVADGISACYAFSLEQIARQAVDAVRREQARLLRSRGLSLVLEDDQVGPQACTWVPARERALWLDVLRNLIRNATQASLARDGRSHASRGVVVRLVSLPLDCPVSERC